MAWKEDALFDTRIQPVESPQLVVRVANTTQRFWVRVLFVPGTLVFQYVTYHGAGFDDVVMFALATLQLYIFFIDQRITRYQVVLQRGQDTESLIRATSRFAFIRQVQFDERLMEALDDALGEVQQRDPLWDAISYLFAAPALMWALTSYGAEVDHTEIFTINGVLVFLSVVIGAAAAIWVYCVRLGACVEADKDGVVNPRKKVSVPYEDITRARLEWDSMFTREYLRLSHPTGEYRLYNDTDDPLYLLRLLKYRLPVNAHAGREA